MGGGYEGFVFGDISDAVGILVIPRYGDGIFFDEGVGIAIDVGVYSEAEDVLVEGGHDTFVDICAEGNGDTFVDWGCGKDTGCLDLIVQACCLVQMPHEDVFVVSDGNDGLENKNSRPDD